MRDKKRKKEAGYISILCIISNLLLQSLKMFLKKKKTFKPCICKAKVFNQALSQGYCTWFKINPLNCSGVKSRPCVCHLLL